MVSFLIAVVAVVVVCDAAGGGGGGGGGDGGDVLPAIVTPLAISSDKELLPSQRNIGSTTATHSSSSGDQAGGRRYVLHEGMFMEGGDDNCVLRLFLILVDFLGLLLVFALHHNPG